jgi:hypothetical protein
VSHPIRSALLGLAIAAAAAPLAAAEPAPDVPTGVIDPLADNGAALAPAGDAASQVAFAFADRNADLAVSWEEYRNRALRLFERIDTNGDGILQISELAALGGPDAPKAPFDVTLPTYNAAARKTFDTADADKNEALSPAEWRNVVRPSKLF